MSTRMRNILIGISIIAVIALCCVETNIMTKRGYYIDAKNFSGYYEIEQTDEEHKYDIKTLNVFSNDGEEADKNKVVLYDISQNETVLSSERTDDGYMVLKDSEGNGVGYFIYLNKEYYLLYKGDTPVKFQKKSDSVFEVGQ